MQTAQILQKLPFVFLGSWFFVLSCGSGHQFQPTVPTEQAPKKVESKDDTLADPESQDKPVNGDTSTLSKPADPIPESCSTMYKIPGTSNPFLAGMPTGTEITYPASVDRAPTNAPIRVIPDDRKCLQPGGNLFFQVSGKISHGTMAEQESDADGLPREIGSHTLGPVFNLSNIRAPINSLIAVFLDDRPFDQRPQAPEMLDFNDVLGRDFQSLQPKLGQIFFVGDGKDKNGRLQSFKVPEGTTRLYLAIMDAYEWNNNSGELSGGILWIKQP